ncbi:hypothetical protein ACQWG3_26015, partial [Salmonella enterica subsp. enterica serovar Infantis]
PTLPVCQTAALTSSRALGPPTRSSGFRWGEKGNWNLEPVAAGVETELSLSLLGKHDDVEGVAFPKFGGNENPNFRRE